MLSSGGASPLPDGGGGSPANEQEVTATFRIKKAAGGVLTAKQAPHRPSTAPALGLRAGRDVAAILSQTNLEWENEPCHSRVGCRTSIPSWRRAGAITGGEASREPRRFGLTSNS